MPIAVDIGNAWPSRRLAKIIGSADEDRLINSVYRKSEKIARQICILGLIKCR